ncbi:hypothetical protein ACFX2F_001419 [Malus domestica]
MAKQNRRQLGLSTPVASETTRWISAAANWVWARPSWVSRISPIYLFSSSMSLKVAWNRGSILETNSPVNSTRLTSRNKPSSFHSELAGFRWRVIVGEAE